MAALRGVGNLFRKFSSNSALLRGNHCQASHKNFLTCCRFQIHRFTASWQHRSSSESTSNRSSIFPFIPMFAVVYAWNPDGGKEILEDKVSYYLRKALYAVNGKDFEKADRFYHLALSEAHEQHEQKELDDTGLLEARGYILDRLANVAIQANRYEDAEKLFKEAIKVCFELGAEEDDTDVVEMSLKLGTVFASLGKKSEAEAGYEYCIDRLEKKINRLKEAEEEVENEIYILLGLCLDAQARYFVMEQEYDKAEANYYRAIKIADEYLGEDHPQRCVMLSDLAVVFTSRREYDKGLEWVEKAIDIAQQNHHPDLPVYLCNAGEILCIQGKYREADRYCRRALKLSKEMSNAYYVYESINCCESVKKKKRQEMREARKKGGLNIN